MLIIALVLALIGLTALVTAIVTSNELIAWVCIGASVIGVLLLIIDALRERSRGGAAADSVPDVDDALATEAGEEDAAEEEAAAEPVEDYPADEPETVVAEKVSEDEPEAAEAESSEA